MSLPKPRIYLFIYKKEYTNDTFINIENECPDIFFFTMAYSENILFTYR